MQALVPISIDNPKKRPEAWLQIGCHPDGYSPGPRTRSRILLSTVPILAILIAAILPGPIRAQSVGEMPDLGIEISSSFSYDYTSTAYYGQFLYARIASPRQIDPSIRGTGYIQTIFFSAGARSRDLESFGFRWRAGLISMDLMRTPLSMGLSLIDYDQSGLLETDIKWINLRLGPSLFLGNDRTHFAIRAVGIGGITTLKLGTFAYAGLGSAEELLTRKRSYEIGYLGETRILISNLVSLTGLFQYRNPLDGLRPKLYQATGRIGFRLTTAFSIQGSFTIEETRVGRSSLTRHLYGGAMTFTL